MPHKPASPSPGAAGSGTSMVAMLAVEPALERIGRALPEDFPPHLWDAISQGMRRQAAAFVSGLAGVH